jgi:hypothetical protein
MAAYSMPMFTPGRFNLDILLTGKIRGNAESGFWPSVRINNILWIPLTAIKTG